MTSALGETRLVGLPIGAYVFSLRNWAAMMLALLIAFWSQLESASTAAVCVGILALQTKGQALEKSYYRAMGTSVGVLVALAFAGAFNQTRELFFVACAVWLGLCTGVASLLNGNAARRYSR